MLRKILAKYDHGNLRHRFAKNWGFLFFGDVFGVGLGFVTQIILAGLLGARDFGIFVSVIAFVGVVAAFLSPQIDEAVIRFGAKAEAAKNWQKFSNLVALGLGVNFFVGLAAFTILAVGTPFLNEILGRAIATDLVLISAIRLLFVPVNATFDAILRLRDRFRNLTAVGVVDGVVSLGAGVGGFFLIGGVAGALWGTVAAAAVRTAAMGFLAVRELRQTPLPRPRAALAEARAIAPFVGHTMLSSSIKSGLADADILLLGFFWRPEIVGIYRLGKTLAGGVGILVKPIPVILFPEFSKIHAGRGSAALLPLLKKITAVNFAAVGLAAAGAAIFLPPILAWKLPEYLPALPVFWWLLGGLGLAAIFSWGRPFALAIGRPALSTWVNIFAAGILAAGAFLIRENGAIGAAQTILAIQSFAAVFWIAAVFIEKKSAGRSPAPSQKS